MHIRLLAKILLGAALAVAMAAASAHAQKQPRPLESFFPDHFGPWKATMTPFKVQPTAEQYPLLREAGWSDSLGSRYANGPQSVGVYLSEFRDPTGAYEAYTMKITPDMHPSTVGELSAVDGKRLLMLLGNVLLEVDNAQAPSTRDLQELAKDVKRFTDPTPLPPVRTYLPEGFADGTQRYAAGPAGFQAAVNALHHGESAALCNEIGFADGAEAMLAEYRGRDSGVVLLIEYPTPQLAEQHLRHLNTVMPESARQAGGQIVRRASLLMLVLGPSSQEYAKKLQDAVQYETQVTWNEGSHVITDPPWLIVMSRIFIGTGVFLVAAIVLGIAFGGVRIVTKRLFPGKVFDRPESMEVLQLGLSSKRIDPKDFY